MACHVIAFFSFILLTEAHNEDDRCDSCIIGRILYFFVLQMI